MSDLWKQGFWTGLAIGLAFSGYALAITTGSLEWKVALGAVGLVVFTCCLFRVIYLVCKP